MHEKFVGLTKKETIYDEKIRFVTCRKFKLLPSNYWGYVMRGCRRPHKQVLFIPRWASPASIGQQQQLVCAFLSRVAGHDLRPTFGVSLFVSAMLTDSLVMLVPSHRPFLYHTSLVSLLSAHDYAIYSLLVCCWMREEEEEREGKKSYHYYYYYGWSIHSSRSRRPGNRCSAWLSSHRYLWLLFSVRALSPTGFIHYFSRCFVCWLQLETDKVSQIFDLTDFLLFKNYKLPIWNFRQLILIVIDLIGMKNIDIDWNEVGHRVINYSSSK